MAVGDIHSVDDTANDVHGLLFISRSFCSQNADTDDVLAILAHGNGNNNNTSATNTFSPSKTSLRPLTTSQNVNSLLAIADLEAKRQKFSVLQVNYVSICYP